MGKNIVICCDGTDNEIVGDQTNVLRLFRMIERNLHQCVYYESGPGTKIDPTLLWSLRRLIRRRLDAGIGYSIRDTVCAAYTYIMREYRPEDRIFLFGFSRGAYAARALAGMIHNCGLLRSEHDNLVSYAWAVFSDADEQGDLRRQFGGPARIKKVFGRDVPIHFVGVWDTVSSFGFLWDQLTVPHTASNPSVTHLRHAVSIDERRSCFPPNLLRPCDGQDCLEVWFPGVHADVGGGYREEDAGLARISLRWMLCEARRCGLLVDPAGQSDMLKRLPADNCQLAMQHDESRRRSWRLISWIPRRSYSYTHDRRRWSWPNRARPRCIPEGAMIHGSAVSRSLDAHLNYVPTLPKTYTVVPFAVAI